jgi:tetratricopeptide (TPR) repeat protein
VSLVAGAGVSLWQARVAIAERDRAEQVRSFVESVLRGSDPFRGQEPARTVTELLQHAQRRVDTELGASPDLAVEMLLLVGNSLRNRQDDAAAAQALDEAVARARRTLGDDHDLTHRARVARLYLQRLNGPREGLAAEVDALVRHMAAGGAAARVRIDALRLQAVVAIEEGRVADALAPAREALQAGLRDLGDADTSTAAAASVLALAHETAREPQAALAQAEQAIAILHRVHGSATNHPDLLFARGVRARALGAVGRLGEAAAAMHGVVHDAAVHFGAQAREVGFHWRDLSNLQRAAGQVREATRAAEQAVRIFGAWSSGQNVHLTGAHFALGASLLAERRLDDAIEVLEPLHADLAAGGAPAETAQARRVAQLLAPALAQRGRIEQARALLHGAGAPAPPDDAAQRRATAEVERWSGDAGRALVHARAAVAAAQASGDAARLRAWPLLAHALLADGQAREALTAFDEALAAMDRAGVADSPDRADVHLGRGLALNALRRPDEARADFRRSAEFWEAFAPAAGEAGRARVWLHSSTETDGYASPPSPR